MNEKNFRKLQRLHQTSGLSRMAFCAQQDIVYGTYNSWLRKYGADQKPADPGSDSDFTQVWVTESSSPGRQIRIQIGSDVVIEIPLP